MSGSGGDRGYDYQADGYAYVAAHGLANQPLNWFDDKTDVPLVILMETGGAGDDQQIVTAHGRRIELQAKHAFKRGADLFETLQKMVRALNDDADLRAVIMVDRHASETITEDLRKDIVRYGQGRRDDLKEITTAVLADLEAQGIAVDQAFQRMRIVVVDLDEGSDGVTAACAMLGKIVASSDTLTAYKLLGKRGHWLMKNRGRDELFRAAGELSNELGLREDAKSPITDIVAFQRSAETATQDFYSPALGKRFPINQAWITVRTLEASDSEGWQPSTREALAKEIQRYREWHRLAEKFSDVSKTDALAFVKLNKRTVIVGGPGAGKSTLGKRLTHELNSVGSLVIRVRLKSLATMISRGLPFGEAMRIAAVDGSKMTTDAAETLLASPDVLIADGLDECDPIRVDVAAGLKAWSDSRPSTSVCVLTRPVGHVPDLLPGFAHAELLPLDQKAIQERVEWFIAELVPDSARAHVAAAFMESIVDKTYKQVASIASRNPLLLTFLVRLHIDGIPIASRRAPLFESIVELMFKSQPIDRPQGGTIDRATAVRTAEVLGWECLERPESSVAELTARVAASLGGDEAERRAEAAIVFWEEHGLIERLTLGSLDAMTFVHPALGEFTAGRFLFKLSSTQLSAEICRIRRKPKYRETILLAAGCGAIETVIESLLAHDDPLDPASTEAVFAAAAISEVDQRRIRAGIINDVVEHLRQRLESPIPLVAIEAGAGLAAIAPFLPEVVGPIAAVHWNHPQEWTRLASRAACLAAGTGFVDIAAVASMLGDFEPQTFGRFRSRTTNLPDGAYDLQFKMLPLAVERIINEFDAVFAEPLLIELLENKGLSSGMVNQLAPIFRSSSYSHLLEQALQAMKLAEESLISLAHGSERMRRADRVFLECALEATGVARQPDSLVPEHSYALAALIAAMRYWETPLPDWQILSGDFPSDVITEVIRGAIAALLLEKTELGREVNSALDRSEQYGLSISLNVPHVEPAADWSSAVAASLNPALLTMALHIPCWPIDVTAAELLAAGVGGAQAKSLIQHVLDIGIDRALSLAGTIVQLSFGPDAFGVLDGRLQRPLTRGCGSLYSPLIRAARSEQLESAIDRTMDGLKSSNGRIAAGAAEALIEVERVRLKPRINQLREAMIRWMELGSWCDNCDVAVKTGACPKCNIVTPTSRTALLPILTELDAISLSELITLTKDPWHGVPKIARECVIKVASADRSAMKDLIESVANLEADVQVLDALLALPAPTLRGASKLLIRLLDCPHSEVRARLARALSGNWVDHHAATELARKALADSSPTVRDSATVALRNLAG